MKTRVIALLLAVCMMLGLCAFASAAGDVHVHSTNGSPCNCIYSQPSFSYGYNSKGELYVYCINCGVVVSGTRD